MIVSSQLIRKNVERTLSVKTKGFYKKSKALNITLGAFIIQKRSVILTKKLSDVQKQEILTDFASGKSKSEIARKFNVSVTAISKILNNTEVKSKFNLVNTKLNKDYAKEIVSKCYNSLSNKNFDKLSAETLLKIIERLSLLYNNSFNEDKEDNITEIKVVFEDASIVEDNTNNNGV